MRLAQLCALTSMLSACAAAGGGDAPMGVDEDGDTFEFVAPKLDSMSPDAVALGDVVMVFGSDFLPPERGTMEIELEGTYTDQLGETHPYKGTIPLTYVNPSLAELRFDKLFFLSSQDRIGRFRGTARVVSRLEYTDDADVDELASSTLDLNLRVKPSIVVEKLRPSGDDGCAPVTRGTHSDTDIELAVRVIGLGSASQNAPWQATMSFEAPHVGVQYVRKADYDLWPPSEWTNIGQQDVIVEPEPGTQTLTFTIEQGKALYLDPSVRQTAAYVNPPVQIGQEIHDRITLARLATGPMEQIGERSIPFIFEFHRPDGTSVRRVIDYRAFSQISLGTYDGTAEMVRRFEPQQVSGCFSGGDIGRDLQYTEGESESRARTMGFRTDVNVSASIGFSPSLPVVNDILSTFAPPTVTWSQTFGVDVSETVTSEKHRSLNLSARIIPGYFGTCYRQTEQLEREVDVIYHNACGVSGVVGQATLTDWNWGFDIATGQNCPPPTNLPPASQ